MRHARRIAASVKILRYTVDKLLTQAPMMVPLRPDDAGDALQIFVDFSHFFDVLSRHYAHLRRDYGSPATFLIRDMIWLLIANADTCRANDSTNTFYHFYP